MDDLAGISPPRAVVDSHRRFDMPAIEYPADFSRNLWGLDLTLQVSREGHVECFIAEDNFHRPAEIDERRRALLRELQTWRYEPFESKGQPTPAPVHERIHEQRQPAMRGPVPTVPLDDVSITLTRSPCLGACPSYDVEVRGDGNATYTGHGAVDVQGTHNYKVPAADVSKLVDQMRAGDLWSMDANYRSLITDQPTYRLTLKLGDQVHVIEDYAGMLAGMPMAIRAFEDSVDRLARASDWTELSLNSVEQLRREGFDFDSQAGADLLMRAVANRDGDDEPAILRLIDLGAPLTGGQQERRFAPVGGSDATLLEVALQTARSSVVEVLLAKDLIADQAALDEAFQAAVRGGRIQLVEQVWSALEGKRPSLYFEDVYESNGGTLRRRVPVSLLLDAPYNDPAWGGLEIARWLAEHGIDLGAKRANGDTLLHTAAESDDETFVRYLLSQGVDASPRGEYDLPPLASVGKEEVALVLLDAGTEWKWGENFNDSILHYAKERRWSRVVAWIEQHVDQR